MYAAAARYRRRYYARRPQLRRRLRHPVISIGNIAAGGRAKTPLAAYVASRLLAFGERPAILSRGYGRRDAADDVVVVRDAGAIRADLDRAGDEPLMLARQLDGVVVIVSASRHRAGQVAEDQFGCTVHVLDDGFQHFQLARDADLVAIAPADLRDRTLPSGRLRESLDAAAAADAFVALDDVDLRALAGERPIWTARRMVGQPTFGCGSELLKAGHAGPERSGLQERSGPQERSGLQVIAVAGIANPDAFFDDVRALGFTIAREMRFRDHYQYARRDLDEIAVAARSSGAASVLTTEKDYVRLLPLRPFAMPIGYVPSTIAIESADEFDGWLRAILEKART